jgi:hypothetical protein
MMVTTDGVFQITSRRLQRKFDHCPQEGSGSRQWFFLTKGNLLLAAFVLKCSWKYLISKSRDEVEVPKSIGALTGAPSCDLPSRAL